MLKAEDFIFEEIEDGVMRTGYTRDCSGGRSDCCTRVCTRNNELATEKEWEGFLAINSGAIQY